MSNGKSTVSRKMNIWLNQLVIWYVSDHIFWTPNQDRWCNQGNSMFETVNLSWKLRPNSHIVYLTLNHEFHRTLWSLTSPNLLNSLVNWQSTIDPYNSIKPTYTRLTGGLPRDAQTFKRIKGHSKVLHLTSCLILTLPPNNFFHLTVSTPQQFLPIPWANRPIYHHYLDTSDFWPKPYTLVEMTENHC